MAKLLTPEEIEALLEGGPMVHAPTEQVRVGDTVSVEIDGTTVAYGHLVVENGRLFVRVVGHVREGPKVRKR